MEASILSLTTNQLSQVSAWKTWLSAELAASVWWSTLHKKCKYESRREREKSWKQTEKEMRYTPTSALALAWRDLMTAHASGVPTSEIPVNTCIAKVARNRSGDERNVLLTDFLCIISVCTHFGGKILVTGKKPNLALARSGAVYRSDLLCVRFARQY